MKLADLRLTQRGDALVATIKGEVDMSNASELQVAISEAMSNEASGLVLDLSSLDYLDSAGLQLLLRLHEDLRTRSQGLVLVIPAGSIVAETFRLAGITGRIETTPELDQAIAALAAQGAPS